MLTSTVRLSTVRGMIYELTVLDRKRTPVPHWTKVPFLRGKKSFEFQPGLNIIFGPNGSGKSTVLTALAILTHTWKSNWPRVTKESLQLFNRPFGLADGLMLEHDGAPARYLGIDEPDFAPETGVTKTALTLKPLAGSKGKATRNMSHGQASVAKLIRFLRSAPDRTRYAMTAKKATKDWAAIFEGGTEALKNKSKRKGVPRQPVILLDEVDRSLDFVAQASVWKQLRALGKDHQVIIASHSPFALNVPGAHYIETTPNYLKNSRRGLGLLLEAA